MSELPEALHTLRSAPPSGLDTGRDIAGLDIGRPAEWLRPRTTEDVRAIVLAAREAGVGVVPVGRGSTYWSPLELRDRWALDVSGLDAVLDLQPGASYATFGAGALVGDVEERLDEHGCYLPLVPDAYGTTSIGSMVAIGCAAGLGMGHTDIDGAVTGLTVVLGTGEVVRTGAAHALGGPPFVRAGLPDPTALFMGAQGSLGVVTEVSVRRWRRPHRAQVSLALPPDRAHLRSAHRALEALRVRGLYETARAVHVHGGYEAGFTFDVVVTSPLDEAELRRRADFAAERVREHFPDADVTVQLDSDTPGGRLPRMREPREEFEMLYVLGQLTGVDGIVAFPALGEALDTADELIAELSEGPHLALRTGLYASADYVNMGLHFIIPADRGSLYGSADMLRWAERLARTPLVPYRWGRVWSPVLAPRLDPGYVEVMGRLRALCDPDGVLPSLTAVA